MERTGALDSEAFRWLEALLRTPGARDVCLNGPGRTLLDSGSGLVPCPPPPDTDTPERYFAWVIQLLGWAGRSWDARAPFVDATLPELSCRLHVLFPPVAGPSPLVSIRRLGTQTLQNPWSRTPEWGLLVGIVHRRENLILCGATGSGKTTLLSALITHCQPEDRILALEDTAELAPDHPHFCSLTARPANADGHGEVTLRTLLRQTLRMRPDRIILGECRGGEILDLLLALNTGHRGMLSTLHANSTRDALRRIELLAQVATSHPLSLPFLRELIAGSIHWVAHVVREGPHHRVAELSQVAGREGDTILLRPVVSSHS